MTEQVTRKLVFYFPESECEKPITYHLVKDFNLVVNIFRAKVTPEEEGYLVLDVTGSEGDIENAIAYVKTFNVSINPAGKGVTWDDARCTHCGHCVPHCPTGALHIADESTREVAFDGEKCIECEACIRACPYGACASTL
jgi:ferredoxin